MGIRWRWMSGPLILAGLAGCGARGNPDASEAPAPGPEAVVTVRAEPARVGTVAEVVEGLGRCEALPDHLATLTPAVEGHVEELLVAAGHAGPEGPADPRTRQVGRPGGPGREDGQPRRPQGIPGAAEVAPPPRGASGQRACGRAGQSRGRAGPVDPGQPPAASRPSRGVRPASLRRREGARGGPLAAGDGRGHAPRHDDRPPPRGGGRGRGPGSRRPRGWSSSRRPIWISIPSARRSTACSTA